MAVAMGSHAGVRFHPEPGQSVRFRRLPSDADVCAKRK
jgi:hypothetical protein